MALDPGFALLVSPGMPQVVHRRVAPLEVNQLNLRTYASSEWALYGKSGPELVTVREAALKHRTPRPQAPATPAVDRRSGEVPGRDVPI